MAITSPFGEEFDQRDPFIFPPIRYDHTINDPGKELKTGLLIPLIGDRLGEGWTSTVFVAKNDSTKAVKQSFTSLDNEYSIGARLHHPNIVKIHTLFIEHYWAQGSGPDQEIGESIDCRSHLVMDRIFGKPFSCISQIPFTHIKALIQQAMDTCLYLFDQKICWDDLYEGNVYMQDDPPKWIIADLEDWFTSENPQERAQKLEQGLRKLIRQILDRAVGLSEDDKTQLFLICSKIPKSDDETSCRRDLEDYMQQIKQWLSLCKDKHLESHVEAPRPLS